MGDEQCNLCLSCGCPFLPNGDELDLFDKRGNLSILHLNTEFKHSRELLSRIHLPSYSGVPHAAHMFHQSHHQTALIHMCEHHTGNSDLEDPQNHAGRGIQVTDGPIPFYETPSKSTGAKLAWWDAPLDRIRLYSLAREILHIARRYPAKDLDAEFLPGYNVTYQLCRNCNMLMTAESYFDYLLGCGVRGAENQGGAIIQDPLISTCNARDHRYKLQQAYTWWTPSNNAGTMHPMGDARDTLTPHVAYYLHMCLPEPHRPFPGPHSPNSVRKLFLIQAWIVLELAALCSLIDQKKRYGDGKLSHGMMQHIGCIELYASYFWWRLAHYEFADVFDALGMDFVQWHQKYIWYAMECPGLFRHGGPRGPFAFQLFGTTDMPSRRLVETLSDRLIHLYTTEIIHIVNVIRGLPRAVSVEIRQYFPKPTMIQHLKLMSANRCTFRNFDTYLIVFGVTALLSRSIQLCKDYPDSLRSQLKDWKISWQRMEIENVRRKRNNKISLFTAHAEYAFCTLLNPPTSFPDKYADVTRVMSGPICCPWACILGLHAIGAFKFA